MSHAPKIAALLAYDAEALSAEGRRRVEAHLADCESCRAALAAMHTYDALLADVREAPIPAPDYPRMDLPLRQEAKKAANEIRDHRSLAPAMFLSVAAAVLFFVWVAGHTEEDANVAQRGLLTPAEVPVEAPRAATRGELTLVAGTVHVDDETAPAPGHAIAEHAVVRTDQSSEAHVRFADGTGMVVEEHTEVKVALLRRGRVALELSHGTVASEVAHLGLGDRYVVSAGGYEFRVEGTRFAISRKVEDVALSVSEGVVEVVRNGRVEAVVDAPGTWRSGFVVWGPSRVRRPAGLSDEASGWPILRVALPGRTRSLRIGGTAVAAADALALRVPPGETEVALEGPEGELRTQIVSVGEAGAVVEGDALTPSAPAAREGYLAPALIAPPVRAGMRRLQGCHRQEARRGDPPSGVFSLRVTIGLDGSVRRAQLVQRAGRPPSPRFRQCVTQEAQQWRFPPPTGGSVTFDQPLRFTTRMP